MWAQCRLETGYTCESHNQSRMVEKLIIAIDRPSGVGKSTLGKALARHFGYLFIDSGAVYRAVARKALDRGVSLDDSAAVAQIARNSDIRLEGDPDYLRIFLDGREVTREIRLPDAKIGRAHV